MKVNLKSYELYKFGHVHFDKFIVYDESRVDESSDESAMNGPVNKSSNDDHIIKSNIDGYVKEIDFSGKRELYGQNGIHLKTISVWYKVKMWYVETNGKMSLLD